MSNWHRLPWIALLGVASVVAAAPAGATTALPDGRAYERVTPADKGNADLSTSTGTVPGWAAPSGERVVFFSSSTFADAGSAFSGNYVASRTSSGWETAPVTPADAAGQIAYAIGPVMEDLSTVSVLRYQGDIWSTPRTPFTFGVGAPGGPYTTVATVAPGNHGADQIVGADADLQHLVLQIDDGTSLSPPATGLVAGRVLYEAVGGGLRLVSVDAGGSEFPCGAILGNGIDTTPRAEINTVSADGSRIFMLSPDPNAQWTDSSCAIPPRLYVRENGSTTVEVSAPQGVTDPSGPFPVQFAGAPADGSAVYMLTAERLTPDAVGNNVHLYQYSFDTGALTHISGGPDGTATGAAGAVVVSKDGSTVYFTSSSQLVPGEGTAGQPNLYRYDVASGEYQYATTIDPADESLLTGGGAQPQPNADQQIYTTPDGQFLVFGSQKQLTPDAPPASSIRQLYRFSAASGDLDCVSCPPAGVTATGHPEIVSALPVARYAVSVTGDGQRVLFDTPDPLVDEDVNKARDVYEWNDGEVHLISSGVDENDAFTLGFGGDGRDAFFATHDRLVPEDRDDLADIYDARIGGGFPTPPTSASCASDDCQGQPSGAPAAPAIGSRTVFGPGNEVPGPVIAERTFSVKSISAAQRKRFAKTGRLTLTVTTSASGRLTATAKAPIGRRTLTVARTTRTVSRGGVTHLTLKLSATARKALSRGKRVRVRIVVTYSGVKRAKTATLTLVRSHG